MLLLRSAQVGSEERKLEKGYIVLSTAQATHSVLGTTQGENAVSFHLEMHLRECSTAVVHTKRRYSRRVFLVMVWAATCPVRASGWIPSSGAHCSDYCSSDMATRMVISITTLGQWTGILNRMPIPGNARHIQAPTYERGGQNMRIVID
jgi:hypothetical protein